MFRLCVRSYYISNGTYMLKIDEACKKDGMQLASIGEMTTVTVFHNGSLSTLFKATHA